MIWTQDELALVRTRAESTAISPLNDLLMLIAPAFALARSHRKVCTVRPDAGLRKPDYGF
jgi:hypothetical protein